MTTKIIFPLETEEKTLDSLRESVKKVNLDGKFPTRVPRMIWYALID